MGRPQRPRRLDDAPSYMGGRTLITKHGYVIEYCPDHPAADVNGFWFQHRLVVEKVLGRYLKSFECVHHIDRNKRNNSPENLQVLTRKEHQLLHYKEDGCPWEIPLTEKQVKSALRGRTTLQAAKFLGVSHGTLRRRFDYLLTKRVSPGGKYPSDLVKRVRELAEDASVSTRAAAEVLQMTAWKLRRICAKHGILWIAPRAGRKTTIRKR